MPISVVVGGQFGSEGKGKTSLEIARRTKAVAVVRTGGTNSGHTGVAPDGKVHALRQLPAAALAPKVHVVLPAGALIDPDIFIQEVKLLGLTPERVSVDANATLILPSDREAEGQAGLTEAIGSTASGTGAALMRRMSRMSPAPTLASEHTALVPFCKDTLGFMRTLLDRDERIVIEGTQGFGLSLLHSGMYPKATSRDTTAAAFVGEAGLSPLDVDQIVLVIRTFPIRVAGASGSLPNEITWSELAVEAGLPADYRELTTATKKVRRIGRFDPAVVRRAISANAPTEIVLNHLDYVDPTFGSKAADFVERVEKQLNHRVDWVGLGPDALIPRNKIRTAGLFPVAKPDQSGRSIPAP